MLALPVYAGSAEVLDVRLEREGTSGLRVSVTVRHADKGWDHYADGWIVEGENGVVLAERILLHPHVDEQPFTRSTTFQLPDGVRRLRVRARDSVHGEGPRSGWFSIPN